MSGRPPRLAIVGASVRAAASLGIDAGCEVVAADLFADADLTRLCPAERVTPYPAGLVDWLARTPCDGWMYGGALENYPDVVASLAALRPLWGNGGGVLRRVRDPCELTALTDAQGNSWSPELRAGCDGLPTDGSWLAKTYRGSCGSGVWSLDGAATLERAKRESAWAQRRVAGVDAAALFVGEGNAARLLGVTRQLVGPVYGARPWQYAGSIGPLPTSDELGRQLQAVGVAAARQLGLTGLFGVDLVLDGERPWLVEINPRITASAEIVAATSGESPIAAHLAACGVGGGCRGPAPGDLTAFRKQEGEAPAEPRRRGKSRPLLEWQAAGAQQELRPPGESDFRDRLLTLPSGCVGKLVLYAPRELTISPAFHERAMAHCQQDSFAERLADIPPAGATFRPGEPVLTLFAAAANFADCEASLAQRRREVLELAEG